MSDSTKTDPMPPEKTTHGRGAEREKSANCTWAEVKGDLKDRIREHVDALPDGWVGSAGLTASCVRRASAPLGPGGLWSLRNPPPSRGCIRKL